MESELEPFAPHVRTAPLRGLQTGWIAEGPIEGELLTAPILILLHGYPDTANSWQLQIAFFKKHFRVIAPFARGARPSEAARTLDRYSLGSSSLDCLEILKIEDPDDSRPVYVVGHDIGGAQAWHLAALLGQRLKALAIINSLPLPLMAERLVKRPSQLLRSWYIYPMLIPGLADPLLRRFPGKLLQVAHSLGKLSPEKRPRLARILPGVVQPVNHYRALLKDLPAEWLQTNNRLTCPVLILWGQEEAFLTRLRQDEIDRFAHQATIRVLRGGHWLHREHPDAVNDLLEEFLC